MCKPTICKDHDPRHKAHTPNACMALPARYSPQLFIFEQQVLKYPYLGCPAQSVGMARILSLTKRLPMKNLLLSTVLGAACVTAAQAEPVGYVLDASHSQIVFQYDHLGYSTTTGMFSGFEGTITFDETDPAASSVEVTFPAESLITGWPAREEHFLTGDFFGADESPLVTFSSTAIEVTGENTGLITGDLTINGITQPVVLDATMNQMGEHPMAGLPWIGFDATATLLRSDFDMGQFAPFVGDEVSIAISIEAMVPAQ